MISNDERIEENLFLNNDVLDDDNLENGNATSMNSSGITDFGKSTFASKNEEISESTWSLNVKQRQILAHILTWAKEKVKQKSSIKPRVMKPFNLFITASGRVGKSHLIKTIYQSVTKIAAIKWWLS